MRQRRRRRGSGGESGIRRACRPGREARPGSASPARARPPITGSESSRRLRVGMLGRREDGVAPGPVSTIRPAYMIAIRSQVSASTPRSCEIRISASPSSLAQPLEQLQHLRLHDDVERGGRLVGDHQRRAGRRAPGRSSPAGAARPRARAHSGARAPAVSPTVVSSSPIRSRTSLRARPRSCSRIASAIWRVDPLHRIERVHRPLEDQRDVAPAHELHPGLGPPPDVDRLLDARAGAG